jgi:hypothetical protein
MYQVLKSGVVIPHMGSADVDTRKKMAELCESRPSVNFYD